MGEKGRKVAVVTGGGRGIGRGISEALAQSGHDVVVGWSKGAEEAADTIASLQKLGADAVSVQGDVADQVTSWRLAECAVDTFGRLDTWVNNAGILHVAPLLDTSIEDLTRVLEVNLVGTFNGVQAAARAMIAAGTGGRIINVSSEAGLRAWPLYSAYAPSKFGQIGLTQVAALELGAHGICVNAICPGIVETDMIREKWPTEAALAGRTVEDIRAEANAMAATGRLCTVDEIGDAVVWLAGPGAANVTGQAICINGGVTLH
jgi:NAD(P)-dependent dehydrogenase (short-subunit alcohol dehydrogenase family)